MSEPFTRSAALNRYPKRALRAMYQEIQSIHSNGTFVPIDVKKAPRNKLKKAIRSSLFFKEKYLSTGEFDKLKARLVAGGHMQDKSVYTKSDTSSPTVSMQAAFAVAAIAAHENRHVVTVDIGSAYLKGSMEGKEEVWMHLDPLMTGILIHIDPTYGKYIQKDGSLIAKLAKSLYGLVEAGEIWYNTLSSHLKSIGFKENPVEPCVFNKTIRNGKQISIALFVDDLKITSADKEAIDDLIESLRTKFKTVTANSGKVHSYLGMTFDYRREGSVKISMEKYVADLLAAEQTTKTAATPATLELFSIDPESPTLDAGDKEKFHSRVAKLLYLAKRIRPDILCATNFLSTRVQCPTQEDLNKLKRIYMYLNGTRTLGLRLECNETGMEIYTFVDAAYGVHIDGKSHTGACISLGKGTMYNRSTKQKIVSKSSTEAELIALSDSSGQAIWTRNFLLGQGYKMDAAIVGQDNKSTMTMVDMGRSTSERTRHISIRYFWVKDRVDSNEITLRYVPTDVMVADILTKPLQGDLFRKLRDILLNT